MQIPASNVDICDWNGFWPVDDPNVHVQLQSNGEKGLGKEMRPLLELIRRVAQGPDWESCCLLLP